MSQRRVGEEYKGNNGVELGLATGSKHKQRDLDILDRYHELDARKSQVTASIHTWRVLSPSLVEMRMSLAGGTNLPTY